MDYHDMTPEERFTELDRMAIQLYETKRWKTAFCQQYGLTRQTPTKWSAVGAPLWAVVAVRDALAAKRTNKLLTAITEAVQAN